MSILAAVAAASTALEVQADLPQEVTNSLGWPMSKDEASEVRYSVRLD